MKTIKAKISPRPAAKKAGASKPGAHQSPAPGPVSKALAIVPRGARTLTTIADFENLGPVQPGERIALVNEYHQLAKLSMAQSCAYMILAGVELLALKADAEHGTWEKLFPERNNVKSGCASTFAFSYDAARKYMGFADAAKKNVPALQEVCSSGIPVSLMPALEREKLVTAARKIGDGKTYGDLATEWGIAKKPQGSATRGGDKGGGGAEPKATPQQAAIDIWTPTFKALAYDGLHEKSWVDLPDKGEISREVLEGLLIDLGKLLRDAKPVGKGKK